MYPQLPIGTPEKGKKPVYEDYYPKSRTGLGGLSFGVTRTSSVFRKDLSQVFCPLIVDPNTMSAEIKTSIRVPENAFPTITRVPGAMISFRYYVEVVMDIRGKLTGQDRFLPRLNMMANNLYGNGKVSTGMENQRGMTTSNVAGNILDTDQVRRDKSVIACVFEVIVGSKDSSRGQRQETPSVSEQNHQHSPPHDDSPSQHIQFIDQFPPVHQDEHNHDRNIDRQDRPPTDEYAPISPPPQFIPPNQPEEIVDEKTRLRRAEEMLLPSAPPTDGDSSEAAGPSSSHLPPTAPILNEDESHYQLTHIDQIHNDFSLMHRPSSPAASAPSTDTITPTYRVANSHSPSTGTPVQRWSEAVATASTHALPLQHNTQDDKQELERQRLLSRASAPPDTHAPNDSDRVGTVTSFAPTAPVLTEEDIIGHPVAGGQADEGESLPIYQRGDWNS